MDYGYLYSDVQFDSATIEHTDVEGIRGLLVGRSVASIKDGIMTLDDGTRFVIEGNQGCGGCTDGNFEIEALNDFQNRIMNVEVVEREASADEQGGSYWRSTVFELFVYGNGLTPESAVLASAIGSEGNGYYGAGFTIRVAREN